ncbi:MAG: DEAD/DEAH box helicase [Planctomycetes bacterium]|nr:DEAD/DEAH box helicase [Planctomycetota bacterium]
MTETDSRPQDFRSLGLSEPLLRALATKAYSHPTPIQARSIPHLLQGRDLLGIAQTGTGKTAAFALPLLQYLSEHRYRPAPRQPRALVLAPTRELATQIADSCKAYGQFLSLRTTVVFGGVGQTPQVQALRHGIDILIATPGRLLDLIQQRHCDLSAVEVLVLDEADRMLDMGFLPDVRRILSTLPRDRQSLLFSATMPNDITDLARNLLHDPLRVEVTPQATTAERVAQSLWFVTKADKRFLLTDLLADPSFERTLVFTRTKHGADRVVRHLQQAQIAAHAIHGNKSQGARERALEDFRSGRAPVLVATDIAARGIDVPEITHVVNFDLPNVPESYVHRIGRTARAGREGIAISFCDEEEREYLRDIEKLIRQRIRVAGDRTRGARPQTAAKATAVAERPRPTTPAQPHPQRHAAQRPQPQRHAPSHTPARGPVAERRPARSPQPARPHRSGPARPGDVDGHARRAPHPAPGGSHRRGRRRG